MNSKKKYLFYTFIGLINKIEGVQVGSINWGRGIGWYFMALAHFYHEIGEYEDEYFGLIKSLSKLKKSEGLWGQFPSSNDRFDASTTSFLFTA